MNLIVDTPASSYAAAPSGIAMEFLDRLRPGGPWVLTAILPDRRSGQVATITKTFTATNEGELQDFINRHEGRRNIYYSVNPTRRAMTSKAAKVDIASVEYLLADLDPRQNERSEDAKKRYQRELATFEPAPTIIIDSGNGIQVLWRLAAPVPIAEPSQVISANGQSKAELSRESAATITDLESRMEAAMLRLGSKAGTQNIDRILRLPGTTNLPNAKKRREGRVSCTARIVWFSGATCTPKEFLPQETWWKRGEGEINLDTIPVSNRIKKLICGIDDSENRYASRSEAVMAVLVAMVAAGCGEEQMIAAMRGPIGQHIRDQANPDAYLTRQIAQARKVVSMEGGAASQSDKQKSTVVVCAATVTVRPKDWLWKGHLLRGTQELLAGTPGLGKSQVQCSLIASTTAQRAWPDGTPGTKATVLMLTAEDTLDQEVVPRLIAAGADLNRIHIVKAIKTSREQRQFLLSEDLDLLEKLVAQIGDVALITIDPITAYMGGKMDSHKATEVRSQLGPLKDLAERLNVAISTITHPAKNVSQKAIDHFIGSQAFVAAARIAHLCVEEIEENADGEKSCPPSSRHASMRSRSMHSN